MTTAAMSDTTQSPAPSAAPSTAVDVIPTYTDGVQYAASPARRGFIVGGTLLSALAEGFDAKEARRLAAVLVGAVCRLTRPAGAPLPVTVTIDLASPDWRTATETGWDLGVGVVLGHGLPFRTWLSTGTDGIKRLTAKRALKLAAALLGLAAELDHAHAVAGSAVAADRCATTVPEVVRRWLDAHDGELTDEQHDLARRLRTLLGREEKIARDAFFVNALGLAHPDVPLRPAELLVHSATLTHDRAAEVILELARRYAIPIALLTARTPAIHDRIPEGIELTERRWRLLGRARSLRLDGVVGGGPDSHGSAVDVRRALYEAGLLCRTCGDPVAGEVAQTLGRCDGCRPTDPDDIAALITSGCPGAPDVRNADTHDADEHGTCVDCHLPLGRLRTRADAATGPDTARAGRHRLD
jgi:hypothetical protein